MKHPGTSGRHLRRYRLAAAALFVVVPLLAPAESGATLSPLATIEPRSQTTSGTSGYWMVDSSGAVYGFGEAEVDGASSLPDTVAVVASPNGLGYWIVSASGAIRTRGSAASMASLAGEVPSGERVTSASSTPTGQGLWLFTDAGTVLTTGDARHLGDLSGIALDGPVVASAATPTGAGYLMAAGDGGVFAFGDAEFRGSVPGVLPAGVRVDEPIVGISPTPSNMGYWLVAADGGMFSFGDAPFRGSLPGVLRGQQLARPVNGMVPYGNGYLMVAADGGIFSFSDRPFLGSLGADPPDHDVVSVAAVPSGPEQFSVPSSGGVLRLGVPGFEQAELRIGSQDLFTSEEIAVWSTPAPTSIKGLLERDPLLMVGLVDGAENSGAHPFYGPYLTGDLDLAAARLHLGPSGGVAIRNPLELRVPLASLGVEDDDEILVLLSDADRSERAPHRVVGNDLVIDIAHFSVLDIIFGKNSQPARIGRNIWNNPWASGPPNLEEVEREVSAGPLAAGTATFIDAVCDREDIRFDTSTRPSLVGLLNQLGFGHAVNPEGGLPDAANRTRQLLELYRPLYEPGPPDENGKATLGGLRGGGYITLGEIFSDSLDITRGDVYQALALSHDFLSVYKETAWVQALAQPVLIEGDQRGGRYHYLGMAVYSFMFEHAKEEGHRWFFDASPGIAAQLEEAWFSGDILTEPTEYVLDLRGRDMGRDLYRLWLAKSGQGNTDEREFFRQTCGKDAPLPLKVEVFPPATDPTVGQPASVLVEVRGGWEPDDGTQRAYEVELTTGGQVVATVLVPYRSGGLTSRQNVEVVFSESGRRTINARVRDSVGTVRFDQAIVEVSGPPEDACADCTPGDYSVVVNYRSYMNTEGFCPADLDAKRYKTWEFSSVSAVDASDLEDLLDAPETGRWQVHGGGATKYLAYRVTIVAQNVSLLDASNLARSLRDERPELTFGRTVEEGFLDCREILADQR